MIRHFRCRSRIKPGVLWRSSHWNIFSPPKMRLSQVCAFLIIVSANLASVAGVTLTSNSTGLLWEGEDSVSLHCNENTAANFTWELNGKALPKDHRYNITEESPPTTSSLTISPVFRNDTGNFTCTASNQTSSETSEALNLALAWPPDAITISCGSEFFDPYIQFSCSWVGGQPAANVTLIFNGTEESAQNNVTKDVHPAGDVSSPVLTCHGDHLSMNSSCNLTVDRPQSMDHNNSAITSAKEGGEAFLTVNLQSGPYAQFTWSRLSPTPGPITSGGKFTIQFDRSNSSLRISDVTVSENGTYECVAKSAIGSTRFMFNLDITQGPPSDSGLSGGEIAGIVIGVVAGVALIAVIVFFIVKK